MTSKPSLQMVRRHWVAIQLPCVSVTQLVIVSAERSSVLRQYLKVGSQSLECRIVNRPSIQPRMWAARFIERFGETTGLGSKTFLRLDHVCFKKRFGSLVVRVIEGRAYFCSKRMHRPPLAAQIPVRFVSGGEFTGVSDLINEDWSKVDFDRRNRTFDRLGRLHRSFKRTSSVRQSQTFGCELNCYQALAARSGLCHRPKRCTCREKTSYQRLPFGQECADRCSPELMSNQQTNENSDGRRDRHLSPRPTHPYSISKHSRHSGVFHPQRLKAENYRFANKTSCGAIPPRDVDQGRELLAELLKGPATDGGAALFQGNLFAKRLGITQPRLGQVLHHLEEVGSIELLTCQLKGLFRAAIRSVPAS